MASSKTPFSLTNDRSKIESIPKPIQIISENSPSTQVHEDTDEDDLPDPLSGAVSPAMSFASPPTLSPKILELDSDIEEEIARILVDSPPLSSFSSPTLPPKAHELDSEIEEAIARILAEPMPFTHPILHTNLNPNDPLIDLEDDLQEKEIFTDEGPVKLMVWKKEKGKAKWMPGHSVAEEVPGSSANIASTATWVSQLPQILATPGMVECKDKKARREKPESSVLALEGNEQEDVDDEEKDDKEKEPREEVTRTPDKDRNVMVVSSIPRKRKGRKNQPSYYNITSELRYLR